ncbi:carboxymuconolactone decarboxylase family protein [Paraburkholderia terrae]|uniref:carboxymuconolactone decarboxylase family protein n=1 Tax=Paraburkholderia terrae TaxID=311230 RepID=UPI0020704980|nr:carboxymuconolactone decarboxylase family protein [Paraburkholderia terrae]BDC45150.1 alkyl hydroperoxide reductase AhpD [Paraburkholderia terrae]
MTRIAIPSCDETPIGSKPILDAFDRQFGFTPNQFTIMSLSPDALTGWTGLQGALSNTLDSKTRDGIALVVSQVNSCRYCLSAHTFLAANAAENLSLEEISLNRMGTSRDSKRDVAVRFAKKIIETRGKVTEFDLDVVRQTGFTDANLVEIIALSVQFLFTNFINNVFDTPVDFPKVFLAPKSA